MEEEDGRPGPGARQSGPADVLLDALMGSLCHPLPTIKTFVEADWSADLRRLGTRSLYPSSENQGETL
jgi:hypothetical protein